MGKIFGYCRCSSKKQKNSLSRQETNILAKYPDAIIKNETYTGTTMEREVWQNLKKQLKEGDTIVFDEVSRMSRNSKEGTEEYEELFNQGINLVFLKESTLNTDNLRETQRIAMTGTEVDVILDAINKYLIILTKNQIEVAFKSAENEVEHLHRRTSEGIREAKLNGKVVGHPRGTKNKESDKTKDAKVIMRKHCKTFGGSLNDIECRKLCKVAKNTYYKIKKELKEQI